MEDIGKYPPFLLHLQRGKRIVARGGQAGHVMLPLPSSSSLVNVFSGFGTKWCSCGFSFQVKNLLKNRMILEILRVLGTPKPRSKSVSALGQTQKLRPERLKHLDPLLPSILIKKLGCLPHVLFIFFLSIKAALFFLSVHWASQHIAKR